MLGIISLRHMPPGPSCVLNHIRAELQCTVCFQVVIRFQIVASFNHAKILLSCFVLFDLRYLQLQQNLFMLSIKKCYTLPLFCHLLARRRPPTFFISWVGCVDICVSWSRMSRYPIESKRTCIYTTLKKKQKTSDVKKCWEHVFFSYHVFQFPQCFFEK